MIKFRGSRIAALLNGQSRSVRRSIQRAEVFSLCATESLEDRVLLVADDPYEDNDIKSDAYHLGTLTSQFTLNNLQMRDSADWFSFTMQGTGSIGNFARINFPHVQGNLTLELYDARGLLLSRSAGFGDVEQVSLNGLEGGTYFLKILGVGGAQNAYSMTINPSNLPPDDIYEDNDTFATATNLNSLTTPLVLNNLIMGDSADYFRFRIDTSAANHSYIRANFSHALGDLDLELYTAAGTVVRRAVGQFDVEEISMRGLAAGEYVLKVFGYQGAFNPNYSLTIAPQVNTPPTSGSKVLYAVFDGAFLSNSQLLQLAGNDWADSVYSYIDPQGDGIRVFPYERFHPQRETIITGILANLRADLAPFGITVQRITGTQFNAGISTGQGATTLFFGVTDEPGIYHVASDIDYANNNVNDIAFVGDEADAWGNVSDAIIAASDVALHEAGHTFGLYHVNVATFGFASPETMGLRYSTPPTEWLRNTSFLDQGFGEYLNHGGRLAGFQNTYQTMLSHFGLSANATKRFDLAPNLSQQMMEPGCCCPNCSSGVALLDLIRSSRTVSVDSGDGGSGGSSQTPSKVGVARANSGGGMTFYLDTNGNGQFDQTDAVFNFGLAGDIIVIGDWNGDGHDDFGVARPNGSGGLTFFLDSNGNRVFDDGDAVFNFGLVGDQIVVGDWNGDKISELGVARRNLQGGLIFSLDSDGSRSFNTGDAVFDFGLFGDMIIVGDWNGDGIDELGVGRRNGFGGLIFSLDSNGDRQFGNQDAVFNFGLESDRVIVGDWNGNKRDSLAVVRANGTGGQKIYRDYNGDYKFDATDALFAFDFGLVNDVLLAGKWSVV